MEKLMSVRRHLTNQACRDPWELDEGDFEAMVLIAGIMRKERRHGR